MGSALEEIATICRQHPSTLTANDSVHRDFLTSLWSHIEEEFTLSNLLNLNFTKLNGLKIVPAVQSVEEWSDPTATRSLLPFDPKKPRCFKTKKYADLVTEFDFQLLDRTIVQGKRSRKAVAIPVSIKVRS